MVYNRGWWGWDNINIFIYMYIYVSIYNHLKYSYILILLKDLLLYMHYYSGIFWCDDIPNNSRYYCLKHIVIQIIKPVIRFILLSTALSDQFIIYASQPCKLIYTPLKRSCGRGTALIELLWQRDLIGRGDHRPWLSFWRKIKRENRLFFDSWRCTGILYHARTVIKN